MRRDQIGVADFLPATRGVAVPEEAPPSKTVASTLRTGLRARYRTILRTTPAPPPMTRLRTTPGASIP